MAETNVSRIGRRDYAAQRYPRSRNCPSRSPRRPPYRVNAGDIRVLLPSAPLLPFALSSAHLFRFDPRASSASHSQARAALRPGNGSSFGEIHTLGRRTPVRLPPRTAHHLAVQAFPLCTPATT
jgi:hypothetical protein